MAPTPTATSDVVLPSDLYRRRRISVREAAALKGISEESFRRHFRDLIQQTTPGRQTVRLSDVLED
jgi:hypothetical protein